MGTDGVVRSSSGAAQRIADTLLRVVGAREVSLRIAGQPAPGDGGQLGQPSPGFSDYPVAPAVFRRVLPAMEGDRDRYEVLISATAIAALLSAASGPSASSPDTLLESAIGVVVDGQVRAITGIASAEAFGAAYLYTLALQDQ